MVERTFPVRLGRKLLRCRAQQILANEAVEIAVQDPLSIADLVPRAVVLDARRGMERVAADLGTPLRSLLLAALGGELLGLLTLLLLQQASPKVLHGGRLVLGLR